MKHLYSILTGIIVISLIACGKNSPNQPGAAPAGAGGSVNGTIDGGGGNAFNDKMLESYIVKPEDLSGYELLSPLFNALEKILSFEDPQDSSKSEEYYVLIKSVLGKSWYLIPSDLKTITNDKIGTPFYTGTVQVAFQTFDAIWIDENAFNKMALEEKAKLILHEVVMGLKILKFESDEKLLSLADMPQVKADDDNSINPERLDLNITSLDTSQVRTVTRKLWEKRNEIDEKTETFKDGFNIREFAAMMIKNDFERIVYKNRNDEIGLYELVAGYKVKNIDSLLSDINDKEGLNLSSDYNTKKGFKNKLEANSRCRINIKKLDNNKAEVTINVKPNSMPSEIYRERKTTFIVNVPDTLYYVLGWRNMINHSEPMIQLEGKGKDHNSKKVLNLYFDSELIGIETYDKALVPIEDKDFSYTISKGTHFGSEQFGCNKEVVLDITEDD